jgi:phosphoribosyl 1,2-cyclic phosphodiesterase
VLASGSGGNCTAVFLCEQAKAGELSRRRLFLIDVGISPRRTAAALADLGAGIDDVEAIVLTHFDTDHFYPGWLKVIARRNGGERPLRICVHRRHRNVAWRSGLTARETELYEDELGLPCGATAEPVLLAHDDVGSVGFVIEHGGHRLGYATDLGAVPKTLLDRFVNLHALCIESNYDRTMQEESARPIFLKRRIMDGRGHLSNEQALEAAREIERKSRLGHIALLHLSRECNCPEKVRGLWKRSMPHALPRLTITSQTAATPLLGVTRAESGARGAIVEVKQGLLFQHA